MLFCLHTSRLAHFLGHVWHKQVSSTRRRTRDSPNLHFIPLLRLGFGHGWHAVAPLCCSQEVGSHTHFCIAVQIAVIIIHVFHFAYPLPLAHYCSLSKQGNQAVRPGRTSDTKQRSNFRTQQATEGKWKGCLQTAIKWACRVRRQPPISCSLLSLPGMGDSGRWRHVSVPPLWGWTGFMCDPPASPVTSAGLCRQEENEKKKEKKKSERYVSHCNFFHLAKCDGLGINTLKGRNV